MDCKTARLLLDFARPRAAELDAAETAALDDHLAACSDCDLTARAERRADEPVGKAMRQIDVPDRLRGRILERLAEGRADARRRRFRHGLRLTAAAAAFFLAVFGVWWWQSLNRPAFPAAELLNVSETRAQVPPSPSQIADEFKARGVAAVAPAGLNYNYLVWTALDVVKSRRAPCLIFNRQDGAGADRFAIVYIVPEAEYDVTGEAFPRGNFSSSSKYRLSGDVLPMQSGERGERYGYVVFYTGDDWNWLRQPSDAAVEAAASGN
jgi:hypothetical protein